MALVLSLSDVWLPEKNRRRLPSGRNQGSRSVAPGLSWRVDTVGLPPDAETFERPPKGAGAKTMTSLTLQLAPRPSGASQIVCTVPPEAGTFLSFWSAKKPMNLLSGDQKGQVASSVPASGWTPNPSMRRTQICRFPSAPLAAIARVEPSGERARAVF